MSHQSRRKQFTFYFLVSLISFSFIEFDQIDANLYSEFNKGLDLMSNYAENRVRQETSSAVDKIYENNGKLLEHHFQDIRRDNTDKLEKISGIEKLMDVLSPYYHQSDRRHQSSYHQSMQYPYRQFGSNSKDISVKKARNNRDRRDVVENKFRLVNKGLPEDTHYSIVGNKWSKGAPNFAVSSIKQRTMGPDEFPHSILNRRLRCPAYSKKKKGKKMQRLQKRFDLPMPLLDPNTVLSNPSLYPNVMTKAPEMSGMNFNAIPKLDIGASNSDVSLPSMDQIKALQNILLKNVPRHVPEYSPVQYSAALPSSCGQFLDPGNLSMILERVLSELELIKEAKVGNFSPDGTPCDLVGAWNSEIIGLRFDIAVQSSSNDLIVGVRDRYPNKRNTLIDTSWSCTGGATKLLGGPFYISTQKKPENSLATFAGICKTCGKVDMIFGTWTFVNPAKDCAEIPLAIDTRRDIFRRDLFEEKKRAQLKKLKGGDSSKSKGGLKNVTKGCRKREQIFRSSRYNNRNNFIPTYFDY